jgi:arylsulfatase A
MNPYADFMMQVDGHMGELFAAIKEAGVDENTLVFFTSDNGCSNQANFEKLAEFGHHPSAGFRGHKADIYEGGHRVPLIVRWPKGILAGQNTNAMVCLTDLYTTLEEITGQKKRSDAGEDSFSLLPAFAGKTSTERTTLISHSIDGSFAIRQGNWKLCLSAGSAGWSAPREADAKKQGLPPMQLYNLKADKAEQNNLFNQKKGKVNELLELLEKEVSSGRCTPGESVPNDRMVTYLPKGYKPS